jgi:hypothetical protein
MNSKPKSQSKQDALAAALKNVAPTLRPEPAAPISPEESASIKIATPIAEPKATAPRVTHSSEAAKKKGGKNVHFFLQGEDDRWIRELATWLSGQGERPNDSLVVRAAIRAVKTDAAFLKAYRQARELDGRLKQHRDGK